VVRGASEVLSAERTSWSEITLQEQTIMEIPAALTCDRRSLASDAAADLAARNVIYRVLEMRP